MRNFTTAAATQPVPGAGTWLVRPGYVVEPVQTRLPPAGQHRLRAQPRARIPTDPLYYVTELYGSIKVVRRNGTQQHLRHRPARLQPAGPDLRHRRAGPDRPGRRRDSVNPASIPVRRHALGQRHARPAAPNHYPKVERLHSNDGGLTMATRTVLLNMQPETQGQSHQISNITHRPRRQALRPHGRRLQRRHRAEPQPVPRQGAADEQGRHAVATGDPPAQPVLQRRQRHQRPRLRLHLRPSQPVRRRVASRPRQALGRRERQQPRPHGRPRRRPELRLGRQRQRPDRQFSKYVWNPATAPVNIAFVGRRPVRRQPVPGRGARAMRSSRCPGRPTPRARRQRSRASSSSPTWTRSTAAASWPCSRRHAGEVQRHRPGDGRRRWPPGRTGCTSPTCTKTPAPAARPAAGPTSTASATSAMPAGRSRPSPRPRPRTRSRSISAPRRNSACSAPTTAAKPTSPTPGACRATRRRRSASAPTAPTRRRTPSPRSPPTARTTSSSPSATPAGRRRSAT